MKGGTSESGNRSVRESERVKMRERKGQDEIVPWQHLTHRLKLNPCASACEIVARKNVTIRPFCTRLLAYFFQFIIRRRKKCEDSFVAMVTWEKRRLSDKVEEITEYLIIWIEHLKITEYLSKHFKVSMIVMGMKRV